MQRERICSQQSILLFIANNMKNKFEHSSAGCARRLLVLTPTDKCVNTKIQIVPRECLNDQHVQIEP